MNAKEGFASLFAHNHKGIRVGAGTRRRGKTAAAGNGGRRRRSCATGADGDGDWDGTIGFWPRRVGEEFGQVHRGPVQSGVHYSSGPRPLIPFPFIQ
jgi:hypothetical protein